MLRIVSIVILVAISPLPAAHAVEPSAPFTMAIELRGVHLEGHPLFWSQAEVQLLSRDGRLWTFTPGEAQSFRKIASTFRGYSASEVRSQLTRELGKAFEIAGTGHYLVASPQGQRDLWSPRFEQLYRSFVHYFSVRGFKLKEPDFPLVAIVWPDRQSFLRYAQADGANIGPDVLGYYSPKSNRITLYDVGGGDGTSASWEQNADTVIHEATHQTAFNTGIHRRFADNPRWVVEGLGTAFEAPGVWKSRENPHRKDRINRGRLVQFQQLWQQHDAAALQDMLSSDRLFDRDPARAYAQAWAVSFFLVETQPRQYAAYLARLVDRPPFERYASPQRLADFTAVFGDNLQLLESRFVRFMREQK